MCVLGVGVGDGSGVIVGREIAGGVGVAEITMYGVSSPVLCVFSEVGWGVVF